MGRIWYGHHPLDAAIGKHDLGHAGSIETPALWLTVLPDLAPAFYGYAGAHQAVIRVSSRINPLTSPTLTGPAQFNAYCIATVETVRDVLAADVCRGKEFDDPTEVGIGIDFNDPAPGAVTATFDLPNWVHADIWAALPERTRRTSHTTETAAVLQRISRAWAALGA